MITYKPSDKKAVEELARLKARLGISGRVDTLEERRKAYYYFQRIGWNMSMLACNPDYKSDPVEKARCLLYNELRGYQIQESIKGNERQLKKYGSAFKTTYERNKRTFEKQLKAVKSAEQSSMKKLMIKRAERNLKPVPKHVEVKVKTTTKQPTRPKPLIAPAPRPIQKHEADMKKFLLAALAAGAVIIILKR
ncbi:hypothetical protein [Thermococcus sp.]|uniref:hypothetical protein n=1 Tax=Thermococcus sp. TaxID=35749 RepID=UPI0025EC82A3|nr:hypothetical protein [Thermococcus sp.]